MINREALNYQPYSSLIKLTYVHSKEKECIEKINKLKQILENIKTSNPDFSNITINMAPALIPRLYNKYHWNIFIKGKNPKRLLKNKNVFELIRKEKGLRVDVEPKVTS